MTTPTFRSQAVATLKSLRDSGYELQTKLNASNEALHQELQRLEALLISEQAALNNKLTKVYEDKEDLYQQAQASGLTDTPMQPLEPTQEPAQAEPSRADWPHKNHRPAQGPACIYTAPHPEPSRGVSHADDHPSAVKVQPTTSALVLVNNHQASQDKLTKALLHNQPAPLVHRRISARSLLESLLFPFVLAFVLGQRYRATAQGQADYSSMAHSFKNMYRQCRVRKLNLDSGYRILMLEHLLCLH